MVGAQRPSLAEENIFEGVLHNVSMEQIDHVGQSSKPPVFAVAGRVNASLPVELAAESPRKIHRLD